MKNNFLLLVLGTISLLGLPGCLAYTISPPVTTTPTAASPIGTSINIGSSTSTVALIQVLAKNYESTSKNTKINQLEPGQSENAIAGVKQQIIDVAAVSKTLTPEENDGTLEFREIARDALLVATHPSVTGVKNLTTQDLKDIYSGTLTNWKELGGPDAKILVLDRPEDESAKRLLRKHYLGTDLPNAPEAVVFRKEGELIGAIQSTPHSIGAFSLAYAVSHNLPVNRLSLDNIEPTPANVKAGKYPMVRTIGIIWHKNPSKSALEMINYIFSPSGTKVLEQSGFVVTQ
ncbi:MAG: substrate-binding domain-containing protein [Oscillatoriaceae cyanobacterium Prado104]|jgi:phosphate transport system substrate-binding protein|nr:substrate-binding domain-containing protein [Oscillatoriaceae cyanobacterium Prado104]